MSPTALARTPRGASALAFVLLATAGCGAANVSDTSDIADQSSQTAAVQPTSSYIDENAALRRITMDEFTDFTVDLDLTTVGGFDLETAAPPADINFCEAAGRARIAWISDAAIPMQYWHDAFAAANDVPLAVQPDVDLLLEYTAQRIAWNFRRADKPIVNDEVADAAHSVVTAAVETCPDLRQEIGFHKDQAKKPWAKDSYNELNAAEICATDRAEVMAAIGRYRQLHDGAPRHLEQVEAGLAAQGAGRFFGSDLHVIAPASDDGNDHGADGVVVVEPIASGPCG